MQVDVQTYLDLIEKDPNGLVFWDIEATGLRGDFNSILCVSFKPYGRAAYSLRVPAVGNDRKVVEEVKRELESYKVWATYYGKGFDVPMLQTRLLKWGQEPVEPRHHLDLYFTLKPKLLMARRAMGAMAEFLDTPQQKQHVSQNTWSEMPFELNKHMPTMVKRCESDCAVLEDVYKKTRHLIRDLKMQS